MNTKLTFLSILFFAFNLIGFSQSSPQNFNKTVYHLVADLNKDKLNDVVILKENTNSKLNPYLLEIKFQNKKGS